MSFKRRLRRTLVLSINDTLDMINAFAMSMIFLGIVFSVDISAIIGINLYQVIFLFLSASAIKIIFAGVIKTPQN